MKKVGLFFGSFNPIHVGHLILANYMVDKQNLDELWFVVSPHNPHKKKSSLLDEIHRFRLVEEAIDDNLNFRANKVEFKLPQPSYTIDTLIHLEEKHPNHDFHIIMGEDNLRSFHKWKNYEQIRDEHKILVYPRILTVQEAQNAENDINLPEHENVIFCADAPMMKISSSYIRSTIKEGKDISYLVTAPVKKYILEMGFYR